MFKSGFSVVSLKETSILQAQFYVQCPQRGSHEGLIVKVGITAFHFSFFFK